MRELALHVEDHQIIVNKARQLAWIPRLKSVAWPPPGLHVQRLVWSPTVDMSACGTKLNWPIDRY